MRKHIATQHTHTMPRCVCVTCLVCVRARVQFAKDDVDRNLVSHLLRVACPKFSHKFFQRAIQKARKSSILHAPVGINGVGKDASSPAAGSALAQRTPSSDLKLLRHLEQLVEGTSVMHARHGPGKVVAVLKSQSDLRAVMGRMDCEDTPYHVQFDNGEFHQYSARSSQKLHITDGKPTLSGVYLAVNNGDIETLSRRRSTTTSAATATPDVDPPLAKLLPNVGESSELMVSAAAELATTIPAGRDGPNTNGVDDAAPDTPEIASCGPAEGGDDVAPNDDASSSCILFGPEPWGRHDSRTEGCDTSEGVDMGSMADTQVLALIRLHGLVVFMRFCSASIIFQGTVLALPPFWVLS
jgi:hypothetical protein